MAVARVVCPAFIGRDSELSLLEDPLQSALPGDGGVVPHQPVTAFKLEARAGIRA